jgi:hypothetical protein
MKICLPQHC